MISMDQLEADDEQRGSQEYVSAHVLPVGEQLSVIVSRPVALSMFMTWPTLRTQLESYLLLIRWRCDSTSGVSPLV